MLSVPDGEVVCEGLSMPHSPRIYRDRLWLHNSGRGEFGFITDSSGSDGVFESVAFCPGFLRGLSFADNYAILGLSKPRSERFDGLALDNLLATQQLESQCAVQFIDLTSGECVASLNIEGVVNELYDVAVLPGIHCARSVSPFSDDILGIVTVE